MPALTINLPDSEVQRLRKLAHELGTPPLAAAGVQEWIERAETDDFDTVAEHVVEKNVELYRRLA